MKTYLIAFETFTPITQVWVPSYFYTTRDCVQRHLAALGKRSDVRGARVAASHPQI